MKDLLETIGLIILFIAISFGIFFVDEKGYRKYRQDHFIHLGEQVIIDNDTATIVDISFWNQVYVLSNGKELSIDYFDNGTK